MSPLWQQYISNTDSDWRTYGRLLLVDWYTRHPEAIADNTPRYLLRQFNGLSLYKIITTSFSSDGKATLTGNVGIPQATISGSLQAQFNQSSHAQVEDYQVLVREASRGGEDDAFEDLPSLSDLTARITSAARAHLDASSTDQRLHPDSSHTQTIVGIPNSLCTTAWSLEPSATTHGTLSILGTPTFTDPKDGSPPICKFNIAYHSTNPVTPTSREDLVYYLVMPVLNSTGGAAGTIRFKADTVSLSASGKPSIDPSSSNGIPTVSETASSGIKFFSFDWTLLFPVEEDGPTQEKIAAVASSLAEPVLTCPGRTPMAVSVKSTYASGQLSVAINHRGNEKSENLDLSQTSDSCSLTGRVNFTLNNGVAVTADLPSTQVFYSPLTKSP
ncbi:hypothetical protein [Granulicella arctica]|uniref:hypothetical protein n=1 Tax=Granulicella arctica TaxID=940613 RepID=UPI0021E07A8C|nr:hypothetical protein [Granulicella arctica]